MARPKKKRGFQRIVVNDVKYQWKFDGVLNVYLERETSQRGQKLIVDWKWVDWLEPSNDDDARPEPQVVTPAFVRLAIQYANEVGWQPDQCGGAYSISYKEGQFRNNRVAS